MITRQLVAEKIVAQLHHELSLLRSHAIPKREREESANQHRKAGRIPLLALRAWMRSGLLWARAWMHRTGALDTIIHMRTLMRRRQITCSPNPFAMNW